LGKYQRHSPFVEVRVAEFTVKSDYRETACMLKMVYHIGEPPFLEKGDDII